VLRDLSAVLIVALTSSPSTGTAAEHVKSARADLNGDGRMERISLQPGPNEGKFTLRVDGVSLSGESSMNMVVDGHWPCCSPRKRRRARR